MAKGSVSFDEARCKGCRLCGSVCPQKILGLATDRVNERGYAPMVCLDPSKCIGCAMCAMICPDSVIRVERENK